MDSLKLEDGKTYLSRDNERVTVTLCMPGDDFPYMGSNDRFFNVNGRWLGDNIESNNDLVALADPEQKSEINQQHAGVLSTSPNAEQRAEHIAQIIQRGMELDLETVRSFIELYDSAVGGAK